jgi:hypothetical protein
VPSGVAECTADIATTKIIDVGRGVPTARRWRYPGLTHRPRHALARFSSINGATTPVARRQVRRGRSVCPDVVNRVMPAAIGPPPGRRGGIGATPIEAPGHIRGRLSTIARAVRQRGLVGTMTRLRLMV